MKIYTPSQNVIDKLLLIGKFVDAQSFRHSSISHTPCVKPIKMGLNGVEITDTEGLIIFMTDHINRLEDKINTIKETKTMTFEQTMHTIESHLEALQADYDRLLEENNQLKEQLNENISDEYRIFLDA